MNTTPDDIIAHWFGELGDDGLPTDEVQARWWKKDADYDEWLRQRFGDALEALGRGELDGWADTARGSLGIILLADQIARNVFRGTGEMYAHDALGLRLSNALCDGAGLESLLPIQRYFAIMPLMHAEDLDAQRKCIAEFEAQAARAEGGLHKAFAQGAEFARKHMVIVERFGRFPHRNELVGRETTPEEAEFLEQPGSSF